jgi:hypothetical protein
MIGSSRTLGPRPGCFRPGVRETSVPAWSKIFKFMAVASLAGAGGATVVALNVGDW